MQAISSQRPERTTYGLNKPKAAYFPQPGSKLYADKQLYERIGSSGKKLVQTHWIEPRSAIAVEIPAKSVFRIRTPEGPQVGDLNIWNRHNPRERFWAARTRQLHSAHVSTFDRLWSNLPYLRPMVTILGDTLNARHDEWGGRAHDTMGTRCDPYVEKLISGEDNDFHCHSNLTRAVMPYGLTEFDIHDVLNVFQVTGLNEYDQYFMETCPSNKDDYFECFAEQDLLVALSACPGGDLSQWDWGEDKDNTESKGMLECCRPLAIEIYQLNNPETVLKDWNFPESPKYRGNHGLRQP
ncbi:hypothetical protein ZYGR_0BB00110 [Zygosaccharomyces rouxii]|uniref:DUF1989 domain-containing protein n=1 Tax=Zygosaccharomyces rouxii TaxID=4956 RepID=A0A1Q3AKK5_ZYGRO|nr:hypothetical protein ZYGR_0BB00110 [Zygosaccharomyces rouxii]